MGSWPGSILFNCRRKGFLRQEIYKYLNLKEKKLCMPLKKCLMSGIDSPSEGFSKKRIKKME